MSLYPDISLEDSVICYGTPKDEKYPKNICEVRFENIITEIECLIAHVLLLVENLKFKV